MFRKTGAQTDNYTPFDPTDDRLASFSSTGPTLEGFVKPDGIAPGGHMVGSRWYQSYLANIDPGSMTIAESLFTMSGTSQAAAVTSGATGHIGSAGVRGIENPSRQRLVDMVFRRTDSRIRRLHSFKLSFGKWAQMGRVEPSTHGFAGNLRDPGPSL